jgi:predicted RNA binding protein YcfA (HicA-like mRNA interferase family)
VRCSTADATAALTDDDVSVSQSAEALAILTSEPLNYRVVRQSGSHRRLEADGRPTLTFAFHDGTTIAPGLVRKIFVNDVGLTDEEARELL